MPTNLPENQPTPEQREAIACRMAEKQKWKELPGNRYTADELNEMSKDISNFRFVRRTPLIYVA